VTSSAAPAPAHHIQMTRINQPVRRWEWPEWSAIWQHRSLFFLLVWRELRGTYQQTMLGLGWILVYPLLQTAIYTLVFSTFLKAPSGDLPYIIFVLSGVSTWLFFSKTLGDIGTSLLAQNALVQKLYFPRLLLPLTALATNLIDWIITLLVLIVAAYGFGITPTWRYLLLPGFLLLTSLAASGFGLWLAPLQVYYRDVQKVLPLVLRFWFFLSPIAYARQAVPEGHLALLYSLNPLVPLLDSMRWILLRHGSVSWGSLLYLFSFVLLLNVTGLVYFERKARSAADLV
jgi:lipopolysaccharide transport system permease protein